jgi:hypothetical protein
MIEIAGDLLLGVDKEIDVVVREALTTLEGCIFKGLLPGNKTLCIEHGSEAARKAVGHLKSQFKYYLQESLSCYSATDLRNEIKRSQDKAWVLDVGDNWMDAAYRDNDRILAYMDREIEQWWQEASAYNRKYCNIAYKYKDKLKEFE